VAGAPVTSPRIDTAVVRRLIAEQFPAWAGLPVARLKESGWDNATFRLGKELTVRLPRYERWAGQVEREQRWLPWLGPQLPLAVPVPVARGEPGAGYPFPWSIHRWLEGEPVDPRRLHDPARAAADLAGFVRALQSLDPAGGPPPQWSNGFRGVAPGDPRDSAIVESRVRPKIAALRGLADTDALTAIWESALAAPRWDRAPVWIHGDLAPGNLLMRRGRLHAVIDFGTVAVGDPACDLIGVWQSLPASVRDAYRADLRVDEATWARGRAWALAALLPEPEQLTAAEPDTAAAARRRIDELIADLAGTDAR
jgi:aminoglycoside phosphotransferase (APT) family kinase protein